MTQLTNLEDLAGKTIARAVFCKVSPPLRGDFESLSLILTDGTFFRVHSEFTGYSEPDTELDFQDTRLHEDERVALGLITQEELEAQWAAQRAAEEQAERERIERRDLAEYARLKAKYELRREPTP